MNDDEMEKLTKEFLSVHLEHAACRFKDLLQEMVDKAVSKTLLTFHPGYGMRLGIAGTDRGDNVLETDLQMVPDYDSQYDSFQTAQGLSENDEWFDYVYAFYWIRDAWVAAEGPGSGLIAVLLDNGMDDEMDLNTGEEPDPSLGFDDIG